MSTIKTVAINTAMVVPVMLLVVGFVCGDLSMLRRSAETQARVNAVLGKEVSIGGERFLVARKTGSELECVSARGVKQMLDLTTVEQLVVASKPVE